MEELERRNVCEVGGGRAVEKLNGGGTRAGMRAITVGKTQTDLTVTRVGFRRTDVHEDIILIMVSLYIDVYISINNLIGNKDPL